MFDLIKQDMCKFKHHWPFKPSMVTSLMNPRFWPMLIFRVSSFLYRHHFKVSSKLVALLNQIMFGCDIGRGATIGGGLYMPHPQGIVIGEYVTIGKNCIVHQGVTFGARGEEHELANPSVGDEVEIATGAKLIGGFKIGHYARIGANAVVLKDVPDFGIAVGLPAKVVKYRQDIDIKGVVPF